MAGSIYPITASGDLASNYAITYVAGTLTIKPGGVFCYVAVSLGCSVLPAVLEFPKGFGHAAGQV
jgi:hypothetical protein